MPRSLLVLTLLLHYLLVVCAGAVGREAPASGRAFAYVHSTDCQLRNAWRGGTCFDDCNGEQYHAHKGHKQQPLQQLLLTQKGVDAHCLPRLAVPVPPSQPIKGATRLATTPDGAVPVGVCAAIEAPPRRK